MYMYLLRALASGIRSSNPVQIEYCSAASYNSSEGVPGIALSMHMA